MKIEKDYGYIWPFGIILVAAVMLAACVPSRTIPVIQAVDRAAEQEVDASLAFAVQRLCSLPSDIMARQAAKSDRTAVGMVFMCPHLLDWYRVTRDAFDNALRPPPVLRSSIPPTPETPEIPTPFEVQ